MTEEEKKAQEAAAAAQEGGDTPPAEPKEGEGAPQEPATPAEPAEKKEGEGEPAAPEKTPIELFRERIRVARPDAKYDDDEQEYGRMAGEMFDEFDKKSKGYDDMTEKILKRFNSNPEEAAAWLDYLDGMPMRDAIVKNMGEEAWAQPAEDSEGYETYAKSRDERKKMMDDNAALIEELRANDAKSLEAINTFIEENKLDEEEAAKFKEIIASIYNNMQRNVVDKDMLSMFMRARKYDKDLEAAREQGKIDARNEKIEAKKKEMAGSGLPNANAGGEATTEVKEEAPANPTAAWLGKFNHK